MFHTSTLLFCTRYTIITFPVIMDILHAPGVTASESKEEHILIVQTTEKQVLE